MHQNTTTWPAPGRLNLWLLTAILLTSLPLATHGQSTASYLTTCNPRENRSDFDGDCKTDISTFNRSTGYWTTKNSSNNQLFSTPWGQSGDIPAPGDYDGDGKTDRAVFRPGTGYWFIATAIDTSTGPSRGAVTASFALQYGQSGDIPVARDYDGDNKADVAVFRPGTGYWHIFKSSTNTSSSVQWGQTGDRVVPGDYDGDGKTDVAVFRPGSTYGVWWILKSSDGLHYGIQWGLNSDWPVQADYDGDGKTDHAIFRPSAGAWWIVKSSDGSHYSVVLGVSGDRPVPGDYDGDGKADVAVQQPGDGDWEIASSVTGISTVYPFVHPDFPTPGGYLTPLY